MTVKTAIEVLQYYVSNREHYEAIRMVISALEKQIPKKPKLYRRSYWCPVCEGRITVGKKYCGNCGNSIDWSEEE